MWAYNDLICPYLGVFNPIANISFIIDRVLASWDDPSDNAAIQIGIRLWEQYGLAVRPADIYLAVLEEPRLTTRPLRGAP
jgi:hypothetical protein